MFGWFLQKRRSFCSVIIKRCVFRSMFLETVVSYILCMGWKPFFWSGLNFFKNWYFKKIPEKF